jgi:DmsE family decaheme c-type cytochrome
MLHNGKYQNLVLILPLAALFLWAGRLSGAPGVETQTQAAAPAATPASSQYVGSDTCKTCHPDIYKNFETTPHWKTNFLPGGVGKHGCEACHGPGKAHVEGGGDVTKIFTFQGVSPNQISERCLKCHEYGEEHSNFARSVHNTNDISCIDCHSPHHAKEARYLLKEKQPDLCYSCHTEIKPDFSRPFHHRVNEGLVKCTDCHNQHGGFITKQLRSTASQDMICLKCHVDKAGPFVYEHAVVKTEGCIACHTPHGSSNPRLLKRSQVNLLCLECHTLTVDSGVPGIPSFHNQAAKYQACTMCHVAIHGSNFSPVFFR